MSFLTQPEEKNSPVKDSITRVSHRDENKHVSSSSGGRFQNNKKPYVATASGLINDASPKLYCGFCKKDNRHLLVDCKDFAEKGYKEKRDFLLKGGFCFICGTYGHVGKSCRKFIKCTLCLKRHHKNLCPESEENKITQKHEDGQPFTAKEQSLANRTGCQEVLMQTIKVRLRNEGKETIIRGLIDTGSTKSYLSKQMIDKIGYKALDHIQMTHSLFGGSEEVRTHSRYRVHLSNMSRDYLCNFEVFDQKKICNDIPKIKLGPWIEEAKRHGIKFDDCEVPGGGRNENDEIHLLIGADVYGKLLTGKFQMLNSGLAAIETLLGWTLMGKVPMNIREGGHPSMLALSLHAKSDSIKDMWDLDLLGIRDPVESKKKEDLNKETLELFNETVKRENNGRYVVSLPWLDTHPVLPSNRQVAMKRLKSTVKNLEKSGYLMAYQTVFEEWEREGIIEEIEDKDPEGGHFLPHRAVFKENSSTKIRPVFDGSAKEKHMPSLNDCLAKGPNLLELIPSIIHRFRENKIGVSADIRKAFLMVGLSEKDREFLKFLWWEDGDQNKLKVYKHCRVVFGVNVSPFLLAATLMHLLNNVEEGYKETADKLKTSFYVDNCVTSLNSEEELKTFMTHSRQILERGKFDLRDWHFSSFLTNDVAVDSLCSDVHLLGMRWDKVDDTLRLAIAKDDFKTVTKRTILSTVNKILDPIGYTNPVTLIPKLILQKCWKDKLSWDQELPHEIGENFDKWKSQLDILREIKIPRVLSDPQYMEWEKSLHIFCDASKDAYTACIFLRVELGDLVSCKLIQCKTRVSPLKLVSIPRMELLACTIGSRLAHSIIETLKYHSMKTYFWTDSMNSLFWIKKEKPWATFVQNRVLEIRKLSDPDDWYHVPGALNPADLPSRGCSATVLKDSKWWEGPPFLKEPQDTWPQTHLTPDNNIIDSETKKSVTVAINTTKEDINFFENTSSYKKIIKVAAWIYRFFRNVKIKENRELGPLNADELNDAERKILRYVQDRCFQNREEQSHTPLQTIVDNDGLIRVKTRVCFRKDVHDFRFPILVPANYNVTKQLIIDTHYRNCHAGVQMLMGIMRERFWILRCRRTIQQVLKTCVTCKKFAVKPVEVITAPLPEDRVREASVFEVVGTDLAGPLFLKDGRKAWVVIFTCAIFRAIHIELITSLSTDDFLQSFRRFIARRGRPHVIYSDNGTNFLCASKELKAVNWEKVQSYATVLRIRWNFNAPAAPWRGGFWERLIGVLKVLLRKVLGRASLHYEELYTVLCDIESIINARPLTYISEDPEDLTPLTPDLFLKENKEVGVPNLDCIDQTRMRKRLVYQQKLRDDLRQRFRGEYLGQLREFSKKRELNDISEGDLVLIQSDNLKRQEWQLGRVIELFPGRDGHCRMAKVKTSSGELLRPFQRLCPLELGKEHLPKLENFSSEAGENPVKKSKYGRKIIPVDRLGISARN